MSRREFEIKKLKDECDLTGGGYYIYAFLAYFNENFSKFPATVIICIVVYLFCVSKMLLFCHVLLFIEFLIHFADFILRIW